MTHRWAPRDELCAVVGIVNRTPDSFFDGGRMGLDETIAHARRLVEEGADVLEIGAVKAGPGEAVAEDEELGRILPVLEALVDAPVPIVVETTRVRVARRCLEAGASGINDVRGIVDEELAGVAADAGAVLVLMHAGGQIRGRPRHPRYRDVVADVIACWTDLAGRAVAAGMPPDHIVVDPGMDFGKTTWHSLELVRRLPELVAAGWPVMVAASRKDVVGEVLDLPPEERLEGSLALVALSVAAGAAAVRVHDVVATARTVAMVEAVRGARPPRAPLRGLWD